MSERLNVKEDYMLAKCCSPVPPDPIAGYFSYDKIIKVHRSGCDELRKVEPERLLSLVWHDILAESAPFEPELDYGELEETDFAVLSHHAQYGVDYSLVVARKVGIAKQEAFDRHQKLLRLKLIERVEPRIIQYRKGIVESKWIKHRNHTYYDLTPKGKEYLAFFRRPEGPKN